MPKIDQKTLVPLSFVLFLAAFIGWGTRLYFLNETAHQKIVDLKAVQEENHRIYMRKINDIQIMLININRSIGQIEGIIDRNEYLLQPYGTRPYKGRSQIQSQPASND
jgi:hypothetical protein